MMRLRSVEMDKKIRLEESLSSISEPSPA